MLLTWKHGSTDAEISEKVQRRLPRPASVSATHPIWRFLKKLTNDDLRGDKDKDYDTTYDNEKSKHPESETTDTAENNSHKMLRKRQKGFLETVQGSTEPKFRKLTEDQQDFLDRKGRYAPYRPVDRVEAEEEDEEYW